MKKLKLMGFMFFVILSVHIQKAEAQVYDNQPAPPDAQMQDQPTDDKYFDDDDFQPTQEPAVAYSQFYDDLTPYGSWTNHGSYGYVWVPRVEVDFQPYATNGHWVMTDYGWTWASNYRWGWAAFHYGRWINEPRFGWMWLPGRTWGPAWVSWRQSDQYYGWAPLGLHRRGVSIAIGIPIERYHFAPVRYMSQPVLTSYIVNRTQNNVIINNTTVVNNVRVVNKTKIIGGPSIDHYQRVSGQKITAVKFRESPNARVAVVDKEHYEVYRPQMNNVRANTPAPKPNRVAAEQNPRPLNEPQRQKPSMPRPNQANGVNQRENAAKQRENGVKHENGGGKQRENIGKQQHNNGGKKERHN